MNTITRKYPYAIPFLMVILLTAFLGEIKITVFNSSFRIGLGSAAFFFLLLYYRLVSYPLIGLAVGLFTTFFRIGLDSIFVASFSFKSSFLVHSPIIGYYFIFSLVLYIGYLSLYLKNPFLIGVLGALADGSANIIELALRTIIGGNYLLTLDNLRYIGLIAFLRSFFVVGLYNIIHIKHIELIYQEQRRRYEQIQMITSGLYVEVFYLKKLLNEIENVTAKSYDLYVKLKKNKYLPQEISANALIIAQEVHEIKKDNQRVLAGLEKIINQETIFTRVTLIELIQLIVRSNQKYAEMLKKQIDFDIDMQINLQIEKVYPFMAILNNLIANAVEAVENSGFVKINVQETDAKIQIEVIDNGIGIRTGDENFIFEPGFTTKFDDKGRASTGIGLSHVKSLVKKLNGEISVSSGTLTNFKLIFPKEFLVDKEENES